MDSNKLIADFMGDHNFEHTEGGLPIGDFSNSWDWLMPVLDKIFRLGYHYEIKPRYMMIKERMSSEVLVCEANFKGQTYNKSQKQIIYNAVVEFIKQYNQNR